MNKYIYFPENHSQKESRLNLKYINSTIQIFSTKKNKFGLPHDISTDVTRKSVIENHIYLKIIDACVFFMHFHFQPKKKNIFRFDLKAFYILI